MSEKNDTSLETSSIGEKISVGGTIRKQRISMNLSIEKISKDLRINKVYIQAVEDDDYEAIPAEPYVRVYVKTIAEYLSLDSTRLLKQLSDERSKKAGFPLKEIPSKPENDSTMNISISEDKKNGNFKVIILISILLFIPVYFIINKIFTQDVSPEYKDTDTLAVISGEETPDDSAMVSQSDSLAGILNDEPEKIEVQIQIVKDSSWIMVAGDGIILQERIVRASQKLIKATANDSMIVYVAVLGTAEISVNGKPVDKIGSTGIWRFTKSETSVLSKDEWQRVKRGLN